MHPERGHEGHIREVPQEDRCSNMYINLYIYIYYCPITVNIRAIATYATFLRSAVSNSMHV